MAMDLKRTFDISASAIGIVALSPLLALLSVSGVARFRRNPFYAVDSLGKDGKTFSMLKFRTMDELKNGHREDAPDDQRTTAYGHFLRATALDELPQLINIFKGDMSFVGPRPRGAQTEGYDSIPESHRDILSVRPGLTGPWQIAAIGAREPLSRQARLDLDSSYARNKPTIGKDLVIILKTIPAFIKGHDGEYLGKSKTPSPDL